MQLELYYKFLQAQAEGFDGAFDEYVSKEIAQPVIDSLPEEDIPEEVTAPASITKTVLAGRSYVHHPNVTVHIRKCKCLPMLCCIAPWASVPFFPSSSYPPSLPFSLDTKLRGLVESPAYMD